ncbi:MAG: SGNH/GDSL hydrolase family protein [Sphingomonas sp.]|uniref:SGNH/GDSL hydrolase family protein n=1 Tax=Sphingomonas sp. TaxID=28214 RepID=UPI001AC7A6EC|nr:SGNH/GDSL hydrolase family protein [Sphingomonas sp.]MBN8814160.1 SGNH/GDSL hydrolase family protein [Sphingomonas sp.]
MAGLGLSLPDVASRRSGTSAPPVASVAITNMVIEGDSQSSTSPDQSTNRDAFYSYAYADDPANTGVTFHIRAQVSRTVGGPAYSGPPPEGADTGTPTGNTLLDHRGEDVGYAPQLLTAMLGSNDLGTFSVGNMMAKWLAYAPTVRAAGIKLAVVAPPPYHPANGSYATFNPRWVDYIDRLRDPAIRAAFADYYIPLGEHPDFRDPATVDAMFNASDKLHMTPGASVITSGQYRAYQVYKAAVDTIRDADRTYATSIYGAAWPVNETNLAPGATIVRRVIVRGIAHAGLTSGASVSGPAGTTIALNGGAPGLLVGTSSGNGRALYNGDVLDIAIPLSALNSTAVSIALTIGGETRTISYTTTANVTPASYAHQDVVGQTATDSVHTYAGCAFDNVGIGLIAVRGPTPSGISVGGVSATRQRVQTTPFGGNLSLWTVPIGATGAQSIVVTFASLTGQSVVSWGVVKGADATIQQTSPAADGAGPGSESSPQSTASLTVPANGIAIGFLGEYGGASVTPATAGSGTTLIDEGQNTYLGETLGIAVATRTTSGAINFVAAFGDYARAALVFKAAGT